MYEDYKVLATICARGGSKGIKGKNKALVAGKPLISYTIEVTKECSYFDDIIVSTNDKEIIKIAEHHNISAPFIRPKELSEDYSAKIDVIRHAVKWAEENWDKKYNIIVDLSVVSPLRTEKKKKNSIELLVKKKADNVFSVAPPYRNPYYNMVEVKNGKISLVNKPPKKLVRRQDAPIVYDMNDSIYVWWKDVLFQKNTTINDNTQLYIMPRHRSIDIDEPFDLIVASLLFENIKRLKGLE